MRERCRRLKRKWSLKSDARYLGQRSARGGFLPFAGVRSGDNVAPIPAIHRCVAIGSVRLSHSRLVLPFI
jgi:hypothetical protein